MNCTVLYALISLLIATYSALRMTYLSQYHPTRSKAPELTLLVLSPLWPILLFYLINPTNPTNPNNKDTP